MGTVYRETYTAPLPAGAEIVIVKGQEVARWKPARGRTQSAPVTRSEDGELRIRRRSGMYHAKYRDGQGIIRKVATGCRDETAARAVLADLERRAQLVRAGVLTISEDRIADHANVPLADHAAAWLTSLRAKNVSKTYWSDSRRYLERLATECSFAALSDLSREVFERWLAGQTAIGMSARTRNAHRNALLGFCNWCVETGRLIQNPFQGIAKASENSDRRRQRRAMTEEELRRLLFVARWRPLAEFGRESVRNDLSHDGSLRQSRRRDTWKAAPLKFAKLPEALEEARKRLAGNPGFLRKLEQRGRERALIYKMLVTTGLRKNELASLRLRNLDLEADPPFLTLEARHEKNREGNSIPLRRDLANDLRAWIADSSTGQTHAALLESRDPGDGEQLKCQAEQVANPASQDRLLFHVPSALVKILNRDLTAADIPKRDDRGRTLDVHALRHTFGTHLSRAGVPLRTAQAAMRHSTPNLTANVYTDPRLLDIRSAVESLPSLDLSDPSGSGLSSDGKPCEPLESTGPLGPILGPPRAHSGHFESIAVNSAAACGSRPESDSRDVTSSPVKEKDSLTSTVNESSSIESSEAQLNFFSPPSPSGMAMWCGWFERRDSVCQFQISPPTG